MKWIVGILIANIIILNGVVGWIIYVNNTNTTNAINTTNIQYLTITTTPIPTILPTIIPTKAPVVVATKVPIQVKTKVRTVSYVTVPGSGSTALTDWTTLTGTDFYFDTADYPGLIQVTFEANMKLYNGSGRAYLRLFDVTHGIGVQGSDVNTNNNSDAIVESGKVYFWAGKNLIRVQVRSETVETAVFNSGRLRLVSEN
jgi:hypothetical protein